VKSRALAKAFEKTKKSHILCKSNIQEGGTQVEISKGSNARISIISAE
jgi:hypothetical protein